MTTNEDPVAWLTLTEVATKIQRGELTSSQVTQAQLARIDQFDPRLHCYATVMHESALASATQADQEISAGHMRGPLHGVPIAVKDLCDTSGTITTGGMWIHRDRIPGQDATVIERLREAGAVLLGKLQMTEGAFSAHHPKMRVPINPWGDGLWSGVSSSGSGVATAAGLCFGSLGSDTLGSIRFPCAANGLTGLKPTWGRVSRAGVMDLAPSMDHIGPMTRSALDAAAILSVIAGADERDDTAATEPVGDYLEAINQGVHGLRIGIDRALINARSQADVFAVVEAAARTLSELGAQVIDISLPPLDGITEDALELALAETAVTHEATFAANREDYGPVLTALIEAGQRIPVANLVKINQRREQFAGRMSRLLCEVDLLLLPAMNVAAPSIEELARQHADLSARLGRLLFTAPIDMSRHPSLTLPGGQTQTGAPICFQLVGAHFDEATVLTAGHAYQQLTDWHQRRPPL